MNIFKILNSGDGRLKEPNLSAFLAYLLNPKADHGLGSEFLRKVLQPFIDEHNKDSKEERILKPLWSTAEDENQSEEDESYILDLSINSRFNVDVVLERALRNTKEKDDFSENSGKGKTKEIVDIIIKISQHENGGKEDISYLFKKEVPIALILIENKIKHSSNIKEQLSGQYNTSLIDLPKHMPQEEWELWENKILTILVSTGHEKICKQFKDFKDAGKNNNGAIHISWNEMQSDNATQRASSSIKGILLELIHENEIGKIPPINVSSLETIRSLINFIEDDFSSDADDQQRGGKKGKRNIYESLELLKLNHSQDPKLVGIPWTLLEQFNNYIKQKYSRLGLEYSPSHVISIFDDPTCKKGTKIFSISYPPSLNIHLIIRNHKKELQSNKELILKELNKFDLTLSKSKRYIELYNEDKIIELNTEKLNFDEMKNAFEILMKYLKK